MSKWTALILVGGTLVVSAVFTTEPLEKTSIIFLGFFCISLGLLFGDQK